MESSAPTKNTEDLMPNLAEEASRAEKAEESQPAAPRSQAKWILLAALGLAAAGGYAVWLHFQDRVSTDDATVDGHISPVAAKIAGNVTEVRVRDNQPVKAGAVLLCIDPRDYQAKVDLAKADLQQAQDRLRAARQMIPWTSDTTQSAVSAAHAALADANAGLESARLSYEEASSSELAYAEDNVRAKQAANDRAQADLERMKPLIEKSEISKQQYDAYVAAARVAESELKASQERLAAARKDAAIKKAALDAAESRVSLARAQVASAAANRRQVPIRTTDAGAASASVAAAQANLEAAELQLSYTTITAPMDGVITRKSVEVGQMVSPGQTLMTIIPLSDTWVTANFKETQLAHVRPGQRAEIHVDMYGRSVTGRVDSIAGATGSRLSLLPPENATGNFVKVVQRIPVKILVDRGQDLVLRPGMNVDVTIFTK